jgi:ATP-dependent DNA helicase RecG
MRSSEPATRDDLQRAAGITDRKHFRTRYIGPMVEAGWLELTIPDQPRSSKQRYRTTSMGEHALSIFVEG